MKVAEQETAVANCEPKKDWRSTIGMFGDDEVMKRICDQALAYRERDREKARRRFAKDDQEKVAKLKKTGA
jgi:hypothetical protein